MKIKEILNKLKKKGWNIQVAETNEFSLPKELGERYPDIPSELKDFLSGLKKCVHPDETVWFLCQDDYWGTSNSAFKWNEWELLSLDAADGDEDFISDIKSFWDYHFPFYYSIHSGYQFIAVSLKQENYGSIVLGFEPEFEEAYEFKKDLSSFFTHLLNNNYGTE